jgi:hypothetical protein
LDIFKPEKSILGGYNRIEANDNDRILEVSEIIPVTSAFIDYIRPKVVPFDVSTALSMIWGLVLVLRSPDRIGYLVEHELLNEIDAEYEWMVKWGILKDVPGNPIELDTRYISLYNAFTSRINHENATMDGGKDDAGFDVMESGFLEMAATGDGGGAGPAAAGAPEILYSAAPPAPAVAATLTQGLSQGVGELVVPPYTGILSGGPSPVRAAPAEREAATVRVSERRASVSGPPNEEALRSVAERVKTELAAAAPAPAPKGGRTPRRTNRRSTYRLKKKPSK